MSKLKTDRRRSIDGPSARWRHARPVQQRSRETTDRFAEAAEDLLGTRPFGEITIQDIVRRAHRPIGSFYARFASKEALLPFLYQRYHESLESKLASQLERVEWKTLDFDATVTKLVEVLLLQYAERPWLIRALAIFARTRPEALPKDLVERRRRVYDLPVAILMRHRRQIAHDPPDPAIRFGVYMVSTVAREKLLFADAPLSSVTPITRANLRCELIRMLRSYLSAEAHE